MIIFFYKIMMNVYLFFLLLAFFSSFANAHDASKEALANKIFSKFQTPSVSSTGSIGSHAKGCLSGAVKLAETGPTWQAMRLSRDRHWGHPEAIAFVKRLGKKAENIGWKGIYVGDISQPRGGPMAYGHKSHQIGLDVDIWLYPVTTLNLTPAEREKIKPLSIRSKDLRKLNSNWTPAHGKLLKAAASDPAVDRLFVTAPAKIWLCNRPRINATWLQKIRPLYGHHTHFHVRLKCPNASRDCKNKSPSITELSQTPDGCDQSLDWWVTTALKPPKKTENKKSTRKKFVEKNSRNFLMSDLPKKCTKIIHE